MTFYNGSTLDATVADNFSFDISTAASGGKAVTLSPGATTVLGAYSTGMVGINTIPTTALDIDGTIRIRQGSPGGNKILTSDANGNGSWRTLRQVQSSQADTMMITSIEFAEVSGQSYFPEMVSGGWGNNADIEIEAPVHLPQGSTINSITYFYIDNNGTNDLRIELAEGDLVNQIEAQLGAFTSSGASASVQQATVTLNIPVYNQSYGYSIFAYAVNNGIGAHWTTDIRFIGARIIYTLP